MAGSDNGAVHIYFSLMHGLGEFVSLSQQGSDGRRQGAACAMQVVGGDVRTSIYMYSAVKEYIHCFRSIQVSAFDEDGATLSAGQFLGGLFHIF